MSRYNNDPGPIKGFSYSIMILSLALLIAGGSIMSLGAGFAHYRLWKAEYTGRALEIEKSYEGKAVLAEAEHSRLARVESAKAEREAADLTAQAIKIVGEAAKNYPEYRQQEYIVAFGEALREGKIDQIYYIPTEAGIPMLEAGRATQ